MFRKDKKKFFDSEFVVSCTYLESYWIVDLISEWHRIYYTAVSSNYLII